MSAPGPLGDEARRLVEAAREWAVHAFPLPDEPRPDGPGPDGPGPGPAGHGSPECGWCPLCRTVAALRGDRPEVTERLAEVLTTAAGTLAAVLDTLTRPAAPAAEPGPGPAPPPHRVEPIPMDED